MDIIPGILWDLLYPYRTKSDFELGLSNGPHNLNDTFLVDGSTELIAQKKGEENGLPVIKLCWTTDRSANATFDPEDDPFQEHRRPEGLVVIPANEAIAPKSIGEYIY